MVKNKIFFLMAFFIFFQAVILSGIYLGAQFPLWTGQEIQLQTKPVDPRSLFRGNYARLRYDISSIPFKDVDALKTPRHNELIFVKLIKTDIDLYAYNGVEFKKPGNTLFIRGRIQAPYINRSDDFAVKYGIEAYFAPKEKALELEKRLRHNAIATIMISKNGKAALKDIHGSE